MDLYTALLGPCSRQLQLEATLPFKEGHIPVVSSIKSVFLQDHIRDEETSRCERL